MGGRRGGWESREDKEMTQAWRTDSFLSDVIIRLLGSCSLNDDIHRRKRNQMCTKYAVTFIIIFYISRKMQVRAVKATIYIVISNNYLNLLSVLVSTGFGRHFK